MAHENFKRPITVLHTEWSEGWGGQEIRILSESLSLKERGVRVVIACQPGSCLASRSAKKGLKVRLIKIRHNFDLAAIWGLYKIMREDKIDVVNTHSSRDSWVASIAAKLAGAPALIRSRHLSVPVSSSVFNIIYRFPDAIITSGDTIKELIVKAQRISPEKIYSIPAGVDFRRFKPKKVVGLKEELGVNEKWPIISKVAVLRSWKGHDLFLKAASRVLEEFPNACFLIVGDGPMKKTIKGWIGEMKLEENVIMTGHREDVEDILNITHVMILSSKKFEATSQVIPQAMAVGVPVVATDAGGIAELVKNKETGILVKTEPDAIPDAIAKGIMEILENPGKTEKMTQKAKELIESNYSWEEMIGSLLKVYYLVLAKKGFEAIA